ncbi:MAG TPA: DHA2 family efflux MFS transporter permease subunit [Streptosporangiaceae bacterium]|jgi:EmrB/QacA subfamily drug resistance transporter|nr:DHA2 family efflux MFS transporter permease subunit [Streptosporangiaceae bacterium]
MPDSRTRKWYLAVTVTASGGAFLAMLDSTVISLAIADVKDDFAGASVTGLSWIVSVYAIMFAAFLPTTGKLSDALGRRRLFCVGVGLFTIASVLCSFAPNLLTLIIARAVQGVGAAAMIPASLAILLLDGPADRRSSSIGLWTAASAGGAALGPSIGGVLIELSSWRAVFIINIPFGIALVVAALRLLDAPGETSARRIPDPLASVLIAVGIGALTLGVTEGGNWGWSSGGTLGSFAAGLLALSYALLRSQRHPAPAIDTVLWGNRTFATANIVMVLYGMAQYAFMLVTVLYLTDIWNYSELRAGLANTPGALSASIVAVVAGRLAPKLGGPRSATVFGLIVFGACCTWLAFGLTEQPAFLFFWLPACLLAGTGLGAATTGVSAAAALSAPPNMFASASGMNTTARQFGGALGIAAMASILAHGGQESGGTDPYSDVFVFSLALVGLALVISAIGLRLGAPAAAPAPAEPAQSQT